MNRQQFLQNLIPRLDLEGFLVDVLGIQEVEEHGAELHHSCRLPSGNHKNGDLNKSASINRDNFLFNCFSCGVGGDLYWLVQQLLDCTLGEAIETAENYCPDSTAVTYLEFRERLRKNIDRNDLLTKEWIEYDPRILEPWKKYSGYFKKRGVSTEVQVRMQTGVIEKYGENHEKRVVIPHFFKGKLLGWTMRREDAANVGKPASPKYLHSTNLPKGDTLFNYDNAIKCDGPIVVVESPMSVLVLMSDGMENVVATFGVAVTDGQIDVMRDFDGVIVAFDGDFAGAQGTQHIIEELSPLMKVSVCRVPDDTDPAEIPDFAQYIKENTIGGSAWILQRTRALKI